MLGRLIKDTTQFVKSSTKFGIVWGPKLAPWGITLGLGAFYFFQPKFLFKPLPIIGSNYLTQKDLDKMKKEAAENSQ
ncbi:hypothetical protein DDB_G0283573 [Dictyostelium discoideum AX4]|uniref:Uncharacterized transmembrane protein DDB_G0283573 n=1 Tax=Dictyostelium discoideum TaxID=44689 RepID=Y5576_DICDI|nr:hypothetical protein DDB_G0283573 [Dictyostelium discoideum AX4]Q54QV8.1 RecName: Full=Uncharacterized transmembrane protein DDB_G0283573 [Dictyostelium discoideum]EAL65664.1 hypothetical protein DDB_G0283573 [Dictyostelium discoideum AX4]|eukprot:XP_639026.1 hypothetical protein DDB_G0283573 [Dictyostelium discoideum AX4]